MYQDELGNIFDASGNLVFAGDGSSPAASTTPVVTNANGTTTASPGILGFLGSLLPTAAQTYTTVNGQNTQNAIAQRQAAATTTNALLSSQTMIYLAIGAIVLGLGWVFLSRSRKA